MGVAGYVAPKHLEAIAHLGHELVAAMDIHDSVGVLDQYFPKCNFFTSFERFERFLEKKRIEGQPIDYLVICTPNFLHDAHCRFGMRLGADVICEKPLVINPWNVDALVQAENDYGQQIANVLQLRYHPEVHKFQNWIKQNISATPFNVDLKYFTPRGKWYDISWKGDDEKSGGLLSNIGIHLFDLMLMLFGEVHSTEITFNNKNSIQGQLVLSHALVNWHLSTSPDDIPHGQTSIRRITCNDYEWTLDSGFENLHINWYKAVLNGEVIRPLDIKPVIKLIHQLRQMTLSY